MSDCRALYVEEAIIGAVKLLLSGRVNEILGEVEFSLPLIEFGGYEGGLSVAPVISLSTSERTEKERIIRLDAYALTITFALPDMPESELYCYAYAAAVDRAVAEDTALGGVISRAVVVGKKYIPPKKVHCGDGWEVVLSLRVTIEGGGNDY
ncbi:hypothetical protein FACS189479_02160 [Spirochaetia bacterium]|nr:hypothetical protein FACS189479_02160 [Spirochaetia bacterium]